MTCGIEGRRGMMTDETKEGLGPTSGTTQPRYTLTTAFLIVRSMETSSTRSAVFEEIKRKNNIINIVENIYSRSKVTTFRKIMLFLFMLKCVLSVKPQIPKTTEIVSTGSFANEFHAIDRIMGIAPGFIFAVLEPRKSHALHPRQLVTALYFLMAMPSMWSVFGRIAKRYEFMPACRMASTIGYYMLFRRSIRSAPRVKGVLLASNYSPDAVALSAAAHSCSRKVVYTNHAHIPLNGPYLPPVLADLSIFSGEIIRETYQQRSQCNNDVSLIGVDNPTAVMSWKKRPFSIGIFLTALTNVDAIEKLAGEILELGADIMVNIRHHPVSLLHTDLTPLITRFPNARITAGGPLEDDIADCDIVLCGNSGVALNVLRVGKPAAYCAALDALPYDYNGFVANHLVPEIDSWRQDTYEQLREFYTQPTWHDVMTRYDASYGQDIDTLEADCQQAIIKCLGLPAS